LQFIHTINADGSKTAKVIKGTINHTNIDVEAMLVWSIVPFYDFCGFWSVAVNSVHKLQFLHISNRQRLKRTWTNVMPIISHGVKDLVSA